MLLALTHALAAAFGAAVTYAIVMRAAGEDVELPHLHPHERAEHMRTDKRRRSDRFVIMLLVAAMLVLAIGVQAWLDQRQRDQQLECFNDYATRLADSLAARTVALEEVERADEAHDEALDDVLRITYRARLVPPKATERDFDRALRRFVRTDQRLDTIEAKLERVRDANPYPEPPREVCRDS